MRLPSKDSLSWREAGRACRSWQGDCRGLGAEHGLVPGGVSGACGQYVGGPVAAVHSLDEDDVAVRVVRAQGQDLLVRG